LLKQFFDIFEVNERICRYFPNVLKFIFLGRCFDDKFVGFHLNDKVDVHGLELGVIDIVYVGRHDKNKYLFYSKIQIKYQISFQSNNITIEMVDNLVFEVSK
jgi:hypothetical protein